jgi:phosphoenolpyruvate-protein kinase (PTS system EI component)
VSDVYQIDKGILQWLMGSAGAFILFLIGLGVKDLQTKLNKLPELCMELERLKAAHARSLAELNGTIKVLEVQLEDMRGRIDSIS